MKRARWMVTARLIKRLKISGVQKLEMARNAAFAHEGTPGFDRERFWVATGLWAPVIEGEARGGFSNE